MNTFLMMMNVTGLSTDDNDKNDDDSKADCSPSSPRSVFVSPVFIYARPNVCKGMRIQTMNIILRTMMILIFLFMVHNFDATVQ